MSKGEKRRGAVSIIEKNFDKLNGTDLMVINCRSDAADLLIGKKHGSKLAFLSLDYKDYREISSKMEDRKEIRSFFGHWPNMSEKFDLIILFVPKSNALINYCVALSNSILKKEGSLALIGENNSGIKRARGILEKLVGHIYFSDNARHSILYLSRRENAPEKNWRDFIETFEFKLEGKTYIVKNLPGVFSHNKLDVGTELLLQTFGPKETAATVLDMGCGSGILGLAVKIIHPETKVFLTDSNALAIESAKLTFGANEKKYEWIMPSDIFSDITEKFDLIVSNPPFHAGLKTDYAVTQKIIAEANAHLNPGGKLRLVANSFLRYDDLMKKYSGNVKILVRTHAYSVYESSY